MKSVLFVCTANQCRSPMAEAILKHKVAQLDQTDGWQIGSAGTRAQPDMPALPLTQAVMAERGLDVSAHRSRPVDESLLASHNLILVMTENHCESLCVEFPRFADRIFLLSQMAGPKYDIQDPVYGGPADYQACAGEIARIIERGFDRIAAEADRAR